MNQHNKGKAVNFRLISMRALKRKAEKLTHFKLYRTKKEKTLLKIPLYE